LKGASQVIFWSEGYNVNGSVYWCCGFCPDNENSEILVPVPVEGDTTDPFLLVSLPGNKPNLHAVPLNTNLSTKALFCRFQIWDNCASPTTGNQNLAPSDAAVTSIEDGPQEVESYDYSIRQTEKPVIAKCLGTPKYIRMWCSNNTMNDPDGKSSRIAKDRFDYLQFDAKEVSKDGFALAKAVVEFFFQANPLPDDGIFDFSNQING